MAKKIPRPTAPDMFLRLLQHDLKGLDIVKEHKFHPVRKWRFDYAIVGLKIAIEVDGAVWVGGRHNRPAGYIADMEKLNTAASMGWLVLRITTDDRFCTKTIRMIKDTVAFRKNETQGNTSNI
jgi:very-short-patch-repair endonuclease